MENNRFSSHQISWTSFVIFLVPAGSLAVSVTDMTAPVVGSSGGVYALVSAHLANVVMVRWSSHRSAALSHHESMRVWGLWRMPNIPLLHQRSEKCTFVWQNVKKSNVLSVFAPKPPPPSLFIETKTHLGTCNQAELLLHVIWSSLGPLLDRGSEIVFSISAEIILSLSAIDQRVRMSLCGVNWDGRDFTSSNVSAFVQETLDLLSSSLFCRYLQDLTTVVNDSSVSVPRTGREWSVSLNYSGWPWLWCAVSPLTPCSPFNSF